MDWNDLNALRIVVMLGGLALFLALWRHTWSNARSAEHERAAMAPFAGDNADPQRASVDANNKE
jgi:hypothetical protein